KEHTLELMKVIDRIYTEHPDKGNRRIVEDLKAAGYSVGRDLVRGLMRKMGIEAVYQKPNLSKPNFEHKIYPYLLRGVRIVRVNQVWSTDISYIPMKKGFLYLTAVIDWKSRYVLSWRISNTLSGGFCQEVLEEALTKGKPEIFNTDQGAQYTSPEFTGILQREGIQISMDGRGRSLDNVFVERLWRTVKYEDIYMKDYEGGKELHNGMKIYFPYYNEERLHSSLGYQVPGWVYRNG
ncbi:MAG: IS3 family transposase, partial [Chlamydiae bacterium]|nr:IS3 family transposase [Chlamydiota bacterium]